MECLTPFTAKQQRFILILISSAGLIGPLASNLYLPALLDIGTSLNTSETLVNATVSIYIFCYGLFPVLWASFSDIYGRRLVYTLSTLLFVVGSVMCALSPNIGMLLVFRGIQAAGSSSVVAVGAGTISDVFEVQVRGTALGWFLVGPLVGPLLGPVAGGFLTEYLGWRSNFWTLSIVGALIAFLMIVWLPETLPRLRIKGHLEKIKNDPSSIELNSIPAEEYDALVKQVQAPQLSYSQIALIPLLPLKYLLHLSVLFSVLYQSIMLACMYVVITTMPRIFAAFYGLSSSEIGLTYLSFGVGTMIGSVVGGKLTDLFLRKKRHQSTNEQVPPEYRLVVSFIGMVIFPIALITYGWFIEIVLPLWAILITIFFNGIGVMFIVTGTNMFLVDAFPGKSASAMSASNLVRSVFSALASAFAIPMLDALGSGMLYTIATILTIVSGLGVVAVFYKGPEWHVKWLKAQS